MHVGGHWAVCWQSLQTLMEVDRAREFIPPGSPWDRLFELSHMSSYKEILVEVRSSFEFSPRQADQPMDLAHRPPLEVSFRLAARSVLCRFLNLRLTAVYTRRLRSLRISIRRGW
ncbi:hypothetical protein HanPI659440_Chr10g0396831 [Helianthus annuus]|nr:hypothetical protein HanPI659440_Chr10g0396831 [Helianthus annuus]